MEKLRAFLRDERVRELVVYGVVGVLTTLINIAAYALISRCGAALTGLSHDHAGLISFATAGGWVISVAFAFWANKLFVFKSRDWSGKVVARELPSFVSARLLSLAFDWAFLMVTVSLLGMNDMVAKLISNAFVIAINYFASKFWVFRRR